MSAHDQIAHQHDQAPVLIVGSGKLAGELLGGLPGLRVGPVLAWDAREPNGRALVVHAGSGRQLDQVSAFCHSTGSVLIELATGSDVEHRRVTFPAVVCPNVNLLMLRFLAMLEASGHFFDSCDISVIESHQAGKTSVAGTAVAIAEALGVPGSRIVSIRDPRKQSEDLRIPSEHLGRHAYHRIVIKDRAGELAFETRVFGPTPYAEGLARIIHVVQSRPLENRVYKVVELVRNGWL